MRDRRLFSTLCARREATLNDTYRWPRIAALALACTVGVGLTVAMISQSFHLDPWLQGRDDFLGFYAGARLVGGPHLYDPAAVDRQLGCAGLLLAMMALDPTISFAGTAAAPSGPARSNHFRKAGTSNSKSRDSRKNLIFGKSSQHFHMHSD